MEKRVAKALTPLQTATPGAQPVPGYVPALGDTLVPVAVYDTAQGLWVGFPLQAMTKALIEAEKLDVEDILDSRNMITLTVPSGSGVGVVVAQDFAVPAGGVWWINQLDLVTPVGVTGNILISRFPEVSGLPKALLAADQVVNSDINYDLTALGMLGTPLRLLPGDIITVRGTVTVAQTAAATVTLVPSGYVANQLV